MLKYLQQTSYKQNALSPLNIVVAICETLFCIAASLNTDFIIRIIFIVLATLLLIFYCTVYVYFMIKNPNYLRSEKFLLAQQEMNAIYGQDKQEIIESHKKQTLKALSFPKK